MHLWNSLVPDQVEQNGPDLNTILFDTLKVVLEVLFERS